MLLLNALLNLYEHNALQLYKTLSYQECKELIDIATSGRATPEDKMQEIENDKFNKFLDKVSYNKFRWTHLGDVNLWEIKDMSPKLLNTPVNKHDSTAP